MSLPVASVQVESSTSATAVVVKDAGDDPDFTDEVNLFDFGFVDSLGATEILLYMEQQFGVEITQKDITMYSMNSINEIAAVVESKLK